MCSPLIAHVLGDDLGRYGVVSQATIDQGLDNLFVVKCLGATLNTLVKVLHGTANSLGRVNSCISYTLTELGCALGDGFGIAFFLKERRFLIFLLLIIITIAILLACLLYTSPSPRDATLSRMPSSA